MGGTGGLGDCVLRQVHFAPLQPLLKLGFGVFAHRAHLRIDFDIAKQMAHQRGCRVIAGIQVHRTDHRLHGIGQDGRALPSAGFQLTLAQTQHGRQAQLIGQHHQRVLLDQIGPCARQVAFGQARQLAVEQVGNGEVEHRVAQKLQPLVVIRRKAAVRERLLKQRRLSEGVAQLALQSQQSRTQRHDVLLKVLDTNTASDSPEINAKTPDI